MYARNHNGGAIIEARKLGSIMEKKYPLALVVTRKPSNFRLSSASVQAERRRDAPKSVTAICFMS
jgi:hypothetical protein